MGAQSPLDLEYANRGSPPDSDRDGEGHGDGDGDGDSDGDGNIDHTCSPGVIQSASRVYLIDA
jgi:hypothetical protein